MIEKKINKDGQEQKINSLDAIVKLGNRYLQVRLIETKKFAQRNLDDGEFTSPMPRAKFVNPIDLNKISYIVDRNTMIKLCGKKKKND